MPLLGEGGWVPAQHKINWAEAYLHTKWHLDASSRLATVEMGRKLGRGLRLLLREGAESQSNTVAGLRHTSMPSTSFIHPYDWPQ